jgi:hypothetical protein
MTSPFTPYFCRIYALKTRIFPLKREITAIQIAGVRISTLFPVSMVIRIAGEFNRLDPLVSPLILCNKLERETPFVWKSDVTPASSADY